MGYSQIIIEHLRKNPDKWVCSYDLEKVWLDGKWVGSSGSRRARECAESGKIEVRHNGKYAEYRAKPIVSTDIYSVGGEVVYKRNNY